MIITSAVRHEIWDKFLSGVKAQTLRRQYDLFPAALRTILQNECRRAMLHAGFTVLPQNWFTLKFMREHRTEFLGAETWQISRHKR
jgi:hypothetical protein